MWLVLCAANDLPALWAYQGLKTRGLEPLELVSADALSYSLCWEHRLGGNGVSIDIMLADGRTISDKDVCGVINRIFSLPTEHLAASADSDYAIQEVNAFFMSWLYSLPRPVLNLPTSRGLSGAWRHVSEWVYLAAKAGLPIAEYKQTLDDYPNDIKFGRSLLPSSTPIHPAVVLKGYVFGAVLPLDIIKGCKRLSELAGTELLGVDFGFDEDGSWKFAGANPLPDLRLGGEPLLDALACLMRNGQGGAA